MKLSYWAVTYLDKFGNMESYGYAETMDEYSPGAVVPWFGGFVRFDFKL